MGPLAGSLGAETPADNGAAVVVQAVDGCSVELVAGPPLTERPIVGAFDDEGRLYVAESSGSNDPVEQQLAERPHRIARLEDVDGDGRFDSRTVFADRMMFPEGAMWLDGSLYVSAPPSIWKLTDRDGDGVADERLEWFRGKTLTGCANDLHGPYAGPDGWIYWCKGAFAEQTHLVDGKQWKSRAAHIFRCRPDGSGLEPVMTGGMDNPVDVVFTPEGELVFSATFLQGDGRQDGIAHAPYGSVFGKEHGVLDGHVRTGQLMPAIQYMDAAAPCGMERYDADAFGPDYGDNLFLCEFNMRRVSRHVLNPAGSTFRGESNPFVWSDHVDFHPTDVLVDADGSLLVIDTGGWYKLCCPTSQLWKPDVLGGIYRVRRNGAQPIEDPRGLKLDWKRLDPEALWELLGDRRPAVRRRATRLLVQQPATPDVGALLQRLLARDLATLLADTPAREAAETCDAHTAALARTWALVQLESETARQLVRRLLQHPEASVRQGALHGVSLHRDEAAAPELLRLLAEDQPACRRVAAEALGRIGDRATAPALVAAAADAEDRALEHSIIYALVQLGDAGALRAGLAADSARVRSAALIALDQMAGGGLEPEEILPLLNSKDEGLERTAKWLVLRHPEWGGELSSWLRGQLADLAEQQEAATLESLRERPADDSLSAMLLTFADHPAVQSLLAETAADAERTKSARAVALRTMAEAAHAEPPASWAPAIASVANEGDAALAPLAVDAARRWSTKLARDASLQAALRKLLDDDRQSAATRTAALAAMASTLPALSAEQFQLAVGGLDGDTPVMQRSAAVEALTQAPLTPEQQRQLCDALKTVGPLELNRLLAAFSHTGDEAVGVQLTAALKHAVALPSLRLDILRQSLANYPPAVFDEVAELESLVNVDAAAQRNRIDELLPKVASGDVRRGHAIFQGSKASCSACHRLGYAGGDVGPELTRIGEIRSERDLLESILFPSLSFVRSYEPVVILTANGQAFNGAIRNETDAEYVLATGPHEEVRIARDEVEEIQPSNISVMPAGLDKQLSEQELMDLVAFLKSAK